MLPQIFPYTKKGASNIFKCLDVVKEEVNKPNLNKKINIQAEKKWLGADGNAAINTIKIASTINL